MTNQLMFDHVDFDTHRTVYILPMTSQDRCKIGDDWHQVGKYLDLGFPKFQVQEVSQAAGMIHLIAGLPGEITDLVGEPMMQFTLESIEGVSMRHLPIETFQLMGFTDYPDFIANNPLANPERGWLIHLTDLKPEEWILSGRRNKVISVRFSPSQIRVLETLAIDTGDSIPITIRSLIREGVESRGLEWPTDVKAHGGKRKGAGRPSIDQEEGRD